MDDIYKRLVDQSQFELGEAFKGLADENVWKRPGQSLLSIGELAGHMAYGLATRLAGEGDDLTRCKIVSPLVDARFRYHPGTLATSPSEQHLGMTAKQVWNELSRVHNESVARFTELNPDLDSRPPGMEEYWTYRSSLEYLLFHNPYHCGQIYTVRHLLGEQPPDN